MIACKEDEKNGAHPGQVIADTLLVGAGLSTRALSETSNVSSTLLFDVIGERSPVTRDLAERIGLVYGPSAAYWLALQSEWDRQRELRKLAPGPRPRGA